MILAGIQKMTLLDFPGRVACILFTGGCDFRCPFCHNASLVKAGTSSIEVGELYAFLYKRKPMLDGVVITGGEPLLHPDLAALIKPIRGMGYQIKLDTNGHHPDRLEALLEEKLIDYAAMDIKNSPERYADTSGLVMADMKKIERSIQLLMTRAPDYEFRTTVVREFHDEASLIAAAEMIRGAKRYFLQSYRDSGDILAGSFNAYSPEEMTLMLDSVKSIIPSAELRGI